jgi:hypothetical protein
MASMPTIPVSVGQLESSTLRVLNIASILSVDVILYAYYMSLVHHGVMRGIVECLIRNREELVDAGEDDDEEEEEEYEEYEEEEEEEEGDEGGEEEGEEDEGEGEDEPPAKRRKKDDDEDKKKKEEEGEGEGEEEEEEEEVVSRFPCGTNP